MSDAPKSSVLIIEDNEDNRIIYTTILEHSGISVIGATTGPEGLAMAQHQLPDVVLVDLSLPGIDGLEVTRRLRADAATAKMRIIALTAHALPSDREAALAAGCDGYIAKPAEPRVVLAEVRKQLAQSRQSSSPA